MPVMTAARKTIVAADNGGLWKEAVNAVIALVREPAVFIRFSCAGYHGEPRDPPLFGCIWCSLWEFDIAMENHHV